MFTQPSTNEMVFKLTKNYYNTIMTLKNVKDWAAIIDRLNGNKWCPLKWHIFISSPTKIWSLGNKIYFRIMQVVRERDLKLTLLIWHGRTVSQDKKKFIMFMLSKHTTVKGNTKKKYNWIRRMSKILSSLHFFYFHYYHFYFR